jgi:hypothetical protein
MTTNNTPPGLVPGAVPGGQEPSGRDTVMALARELEALRLRLEPLDGLDEKLAELADMVAALANEVAARDPRSTAAGALSWLDLPDGSDGGEPLEADSVERLMAALVMWVDRVYLRYADAARHFPECWLWHPDVLEELTWLQHAWQCAYQDEHAAPGRAWDWHDRYRPGVVRRIRDLAGRCSLDKHTHRETGAAPTATGVGELPWLAAWWAGNRHTAPPAPSDAVLAQARQAEAERLRERGRR